MSDSEPECEPEVPIASQDPLLQRLNTGKQLTESQFRELRGKYFSVRHYTVPECGHKLDMINEPTFRNCEYCWWAFFSSHGQLVQVTDEMFQTHGKAFLDKMRGVKYRKQFCRYMSTLARFKQEAATMQAEKEAQENEVVSEQRTGEVTAPTTECEGTDAAALPWDEEDERLLASSMRDMNADLSDDRH